MARYLSITTERNKNLIPVDHWVLDELRKIDSLFQMFWHKKARRFLIYKKVGFIPHLNELSDRDNAEMKKMTGKLILWLACENLLTNAFIEPGGWVINKIRQKMFKSIDKWENLRKMAEEHEEPSETEKTRLEKLDNIYSEMGKDQDKAEVGKLSLCLGLPGKASVHKKVPPRKIVFIDSKTGKVLGYKDASGIKRLA